MQTLLVPACPDHSGITREAVKYSVGLDVSSKELEVCFKELLENQETQIKGSRKFLNTPGGFKTLEEWTAKRQKDKALPLVMVMEATGVYYEKAAYYFKEAGYSVAVILANQAKDYLKSLGNKSKTDKLDGKGLAQMGAERKLRIWQPSGKYLLKLRHLSRHKNSLEKMKTEVQNRLHAQQHSAQSNEWVIIELKKQITAFKEQITTTGQAIKELVKQNDAFHERRL